MPLSRYFDVEKQRSFLFITNNFLLSAQAIADIYRCRWQVEQFFKRIKQHLRIKAFFGTSESAVKTQIWIALSVYLIVAFAKKQLGLDESLYSLLQVISITSTEKMSILRAFHDLDDRSLTSPTRNQLNLFDCPTGQL